MINFKVNGADLSRAIFGGSVSDISAEISMMISLIYGALYESDKDEAKYFRRNMVSLVTDPEIVDKVFNSELVKSLKENGGTEVEVEKVDFDKNEIINQIMKELFGK